MSDDKTPIHSEGWKQWSAQVKESLDKLEGKVDILENRITKHREEFLVETTTLKVKAGVVGTIAGIVAGLITSIIGGLIVYQLTVANHTKMKPDTHSHPKTTVEQPLGMMPSKLPSKFFIGEDIG